MIKTNEVNIILGGVVIIAIFAVFFNQGSAEGGGGDMPTNLSEDQITKIFYEEAAHYEDRFDAKLCPVELKIEEDLSELAGQYFAGNGVRWQNASGYFFESFGDKATILIEECPECTELNLRRVMRHEFCHHYLRCTCGFKGYYVTDGSSNTESLPSVFEEPFCEGYSQNSIGIHYNLKNDTYMDFMDYPMGFFKCGLESCDPMGCYEKYFGKEWTIDT